jgi:hypothetical protein
MHTRETHHNFSEPSLAPSRNCLASLRVRHRLRFLLRSNTKHPPTILQPQMRLSAASPGHCCWRFGTSTEHLALKLGEHWWPTPSVLGPENRELILEICCAQLGRGVQPGQRLLCRSASCLQNRLTWPPTPSGCSNPTKFSGDSDPQIFLMCSKNTIIQKKTRRPSRGQEILKIMKHLLGLLQ